MRVLLSWLNELAPVGDDADALAALMNDLGLAVDVVDRVGEAVGGAPSSSRREARAARRRRHR